MKYILFFILSIAGTASLALGTDQSNSVEASVRSCVVCGEANTIKRCGKCKTIYCSKACQLQDWPKHKKTCYQIAQQLENKMEKTQVVYFPGPHKVNGAFTSEALQSQKRLYQELKKFISQHPNARIISENLYYSPDDDSPTWFKNRDARFCTTGRGLEQDGALATLIAEGVIDGRHLVKSISLAQESPYWKGDYFINNLRTLLYSRAHEVGELQAMDEILPQLRKVVGIDREVEVIGVLAKSIEQYPGHPHVIIFGSCHEFSRYLKNVKSLGFSIAPGFCETPFFDDPMQPTEEDYTEFFKTYQNPLEKI